jgi:hypothetical protein
MGRVTEETAYQDIKALLKRGDFATAEKLLKKFSQELTEAQRQELNQIQRSNGRQRRFTQRLEALRRRRRPRFLPYRWSWALLLVGTLAYMAFALVWMRWLPPITLHGTALTRLLQAVWHFSPLYFYFFFPVFLYDTKSYLWELYRWKGAKPELAKVLEIRQEDCIGQTFRSGEIYHYQKSYALVRSVEPQNRNPETIRFALYESANGRSLIRRGEERLHPWSFHPGETVTLYRDRSGFPSLVHHTPRSLTREWLGKLGKHGGWLALFYLAFLVNALSK